MFRGTPETTSRNPVWKPLL